VIGVTAGCAGSDYPCKHRFNRKEASVTDRSWLPFTGMEELPFKRVPEGWVYRAPNPWLLGPAHYLLNDVQKSEVAGHLRRAWRFTFLTIIVIVAAGVPLTASKFDAVGMIANAYFCRAIRSVIAGLPPTAPAITRSDAIRIQIAAFSGKHMLFLALLSTAMFALTALPPLLGSEGWDLWSVCGAILFGAGAAYWFALYAAKRRRAAA
jgi:hypothetical protein